MDECCIDIYIYKIKNYPKENTKIKFNEIKKTTDMSSGIIEVEGNNNSMDIASYDPINSRNTKNKYYKLYLNSFAKDKNPKIDNNQPRIQEDTINKTIETLKDKYKIEEDNMHERGFIKKLIIPSTKKVIIFGDHHGSFHTFFRNLLRLHIMMVLDFKTMIINEPYILVFLGDIVDRGRYAVEILDIIFQLICNNPDKIILNRGNHEVDDINSKYYFRQEMINKYGDTILYDKINQIFSMCPTAVLIYTTIIINNKEEERRFWLCHGMIPDSDNMEDLYKYLHSSEDIYILSKTMADMIRWNDTPKNNEISYTNQSGRTQVRLSHLKTFLTKSKINFIIRGHEDHASNAWLSMVNGEKYHLNTYPENNYTKVKLNNIKYIHNDYDIKQIDGPIQTILVDNVDNNTNRILTISTNTDYKRPLTSDSFVVLRFNNITLQKVQDTISNRIELDIYKCKYLKYKTKYLKLKTLI